MDPKHALSKKDLLELLVAKLSEFVVVLLDTNGCFASWHPGVEIEFGYTEQEFIGQGLEILLPPSERSNQSAQLELEQAAESGRASDTRWLVNKKGHRMLVEGVTVGLYDDAGTLAGFGKVLRDVTERKRAEDSLRVLAGALDQSPVLVRDWDGTVTHWTAGCARLYGWIENEAVGQNIHQLLGAVFPAPLETIQDQLLASGIWNGELECMRRDGSRIFISTRWVLLPKEAEERPRVIETHTDITARLEVQGELEAANGRLQRMAAELARSNEELEEFARITSHDLSAPLTSTRWLVDLLGSRHQEQLDSQGRLYVKQIAQGLERMADLVEGVLAHAQVGRTPIGSSEAAPARDALLIAIENLRRDITTSGATVLHDNLPEAHIEPRALSQLFQNLLSNAVKYRRPDVKPEIRVSATRRGAMWLFSVADNGIGIDAQWFQRIFQPMQRVHGSAVAGSGIGLATCKKIVTRAGGAIWVDSEVGRGSTFFFTLPGPPDHPAGPSGVP
ncbi:MAG: PAS domain S-box protein [Acidobacteriaceae bacterium]|nr:PAS domain S-box protein [Acidobacteriaceae bacterium]